jgi:hypothetical protein
MPLGEALSAPPHRALLEIGIAGDGDAEGTDGTEGVLIREGDAAGTEGVLTREGDATGATEEGVAG